MKTIANISIVLGSVSLLFLGACSSGDKATKTQATAANATSEIAAKTAKDGGEHKDGEKHVEGDSHKASEGKDDKGGHKGQVVQTGKYHIELSPDLDKDSIHLDTKLHGEQDKPIINAKLIAQVQLPDGTNKTLPVAYNTEEKQYTAKLAAITATGDYKVVIQADVNGDRFNSRFSFKR
jgi:hypothetical protein